MSVQEALQKDLEKAIYEMSGKVYTGKTDPKTAIFCQKLSEVLITHIIINSSGEGSGGSVIPKATVEETEIGTNDLSYITPYTLAAKLLGFLNVTAPEIATGKYLRDDLTWNEIIVPEPEEPTVISFVDGEIPNGLINGVNGIFTISSTPIEGSLRVYLNGLRLKNTVDYTRIGLTITMSTIPYEDDILQVDYAY